MSESCADQTEAIPSLEHVLVPKSCCFRQETPGHRENSSLLSPTHVAIVIGGCATFSSTRQNFTSKEVVKVYKCYQQMSNSTVVDMGQQRKMDLCLVLVTRLKNIWGKEVESLLLRRRTKAESNTMWTTRKGMVFCRKKVSAPGIFTGTIKWNLYKTLLLHESEGKSITVIAEQGCETTCFNRAGTKQ